MVFLILTIGPPCCGKTTWVNKYVHDKSAVHVISSDKVREELGIYKLSEKEVGDHEDKVYEEVFKLACDSLQSGYDTIVDSCNSQYEYWLRYKDYCYKNNIIFICKKFDNDLDDIQKKMSNRDRKVPLDVVKNKRNSIDLYFPKFKRLFNFFL